MADIVSHGLAKHSSSAEVSPQARESAADRVAEGIRQRLRRGLLSPGQRLVEPDLSAEFSASRTIVREALKKLSAEGIVDLELHRGATIHQLSREELAHIYEVREVLEGLAARKAALRMAAGASTSLLEESIAVLDAAASAMRLDAYTDANLTFHQTIVKMGGNTSLESLVSRLQLPLSRQMYSLLISPEGIQRSMDGHIRIANAIIAANPDEAERSMRAHISESAEILQGLDDLYFAQRRD